MTTGIDITERPSIKPPLTFEETLPARTIRAIVDRQQIGVIPGSSQIPAPRTFITVKNHPIEGICTAESISATEPFDEALVATALAFLDSLGAESITYYPFGTSLDIGKDHLMLAVREGGTPEKRRIMDIISQDKGMLTLEVR
jgi:hypothetical protein